CGRACPTKSHSWRAASSALSAEVESPWSFAKADPEGCLSFLLERRDVEGPADQNLAGPAEKAALLAVDLIGEKPAVARDHHQAVAIRHAIAISPHQHLGHDHIALRVLDPDPHRRLGSGHQPRRL